MRLCWSLLSVGLFALIWEAAWLAGLADPRLLPPPHVFLADFGAQARHFNTSDRWLITSGEVAARPAALAVLSTVTATATRVLAGLALAAIAALTMGLAARYWPLFGKLTLPTVTFLAPVSAVTWLPVAIFIFGVGSMPAIFMVFIALFFLMLLATVSQIDAVEAPYLEVARMMGASRRQIFLQVVLPAILPGLFVILRLNLFAAWMVALFVEATGVSRGLGQVVMLVRNGFNPRLVFFTIVLLGVIGYLFDLGFRLIERRALYWLPGGGGGQYLDR
ncbi:ABC transporter permease subunit [Sedimentitalea sp. JM2-8]|uniref:ABC transporter permease subunit n=1 Tax=Sedimentitalea xiamensis TaxID=3050037 RepID=A0ABT7FHR1_9RHOB|nr:ABC transporter permease subunit [Sedimentitalea xiamensis]MDK3074674.1 ABC transporter permease subunit [Sedimentitalea xiamensis]